MNAPKITRRRVAVLGIVTLCATLLGGQLVAQARDEHAQRPPAGLSGKERAIVLKATKRLEDVDVALAAGYLPTENCSELVGVGGMGYHFLNPTLASDSVVDPKRPEVLLYNEDANGDLELIGVEWFVADPDQDPATDGGRPSLFEHPFDGPMLGHEPGMPVHFDLHAWVYTDNPTGQLSAWNPNVACPAP